jgi:hypothetical protein
MVRPRADGAGKRTTGADLSRLAVSSHFHHRKHEPARQRKTVRKALEED